MLRFDKLVRPSMTIRDVKRQFPYTGAVFESFGFRSVCDDCAIEVAARRQGLAAVEIVDALNRAIAAEGGSGE